MTALALVVCAAAPGSIHAQAQPAIPTDVPVPLSLPDNTEPPVRVSDTARDQQGPPERPAEKAPERPAEKAPERPAEKAPERPAEQDPSDQSEATEVIEIVERFVPGSAQTVTAAELEKFEYNDIHRVLGSVPGVYIREEEGYGLRPNIGMRGSGSERSAKIALMEDGVLIAPAPYSAPAAYYFPLVTRMERVEVLKGPAAIQYGPNTVGGALNMISRSLPDRRQAEIDVAAGQNLFGKVHASYGERFDHIAFLIEGIKLRTDGFKVLDNGGDTGFDKNDVQLKLRLNNDTRSRIYHQLDLKVGYSDEVSNETYTGLTEADFRATPYRRYAGTQLDRVDWRHLRTQIGHQVDLGAAFQLTTTLYRNGFSRDWTKLNSFNSDRSLTEILRNPTAGNNAIFYSVLQGESDSSSDAEMLLLGTNARDFVSQGVQVRGHTEKELLGASHIVDLGLRYHYDRADRFEYDEGHWMMSGALVRADSPLVVTRDARGSARALAAYARDKLRAGRFTATLGARTEMIANQWQDRRDPEKDYSDSYFVFIPGAGMVYQASSSMDVLAGVHKGFVPVSPGQNAEVAPEESVNYEAGLRYARAMTSAEIIGFFSDYSNLKGACSLSTGCPSDQIGDEFNGGRVHVYGVEAMAHAELPLRSALRVPVRASYTFNRSRFRTAFASSNPEWGDIEIGYELPYLPAHHVSLQVGLGQSWAHAPERAGPRPMRWEVTLSGRYTSAMRNIAGQGETAPAPEERTDAIAVLDLSASHDFGRWGKAYLTVDNLLDQAHMVSRHPFGARPGKPRIIIVGYKNRF